MPVRGWIEVNELYCKGCELCVSACPQSVLILEKVHLTPKGYHPVSLKSDGCTGCGICAIVCPEAALTVFRETPVKARLAEAASPAGSGDVQTLFAEHRLGGA